MPVNTVYAIGASQLSVTGSQGLSAQAKDAGTHLIGEEITLDSFNWESIDVSDGDPDFADNDGSQRIDGA